MNQQKEIEELAKAIFESGIVIEGIDRVYGLFDGDDHFHRLARALYDAGYRKIWNEEIKELRGEI